MPMEKRKQHYVLRLTVKPSLRTRLKRLMALSKAKNYAEIIDAALNVYEAYLLGEKIKKGV